eukprot:248073-Amphidinium_carterae.2
MSASVEVLILRGLYIGSAIPPQQGATPHITQYEPLATPQQAIRTRGVWLIYQADRKTRTDDMERSKRTPEDQRAQAERAEVPEAVLVTKAFHRPKATWMQS